MKASPEMKMTSIIDMSQNYIYVFPMVVNTLANILFTTIPRKGNPLLANTFSPVGCLPLNPPDHSLRMLASPHC